MMSRRRGLRILILSMLSSSPKNGVEVMNEIEAATHGWWRPSPGSVYPVLEQLAKDGLVKKRDDGRYELTAKANEEMEWPFGPGMGKAQSVEDMLSEMNSYVTYFEDLSSSDRSKVSGHSEKIKELSERLSRLAQSD